MFLESFIVSCFGSNPTVKKITLALPGFQAVWMTLIFQWTNGGFGEDVDLSQGAHKVSTFYVAFLRGTPPPVSALL